MQQREQGWNVIQDKILELESHDRVPLRQSLQLNAIKTARSIAFSGIGIPDTLPYGKLEISARAGTGEVRVLFSGRLERF